LVIPSLACRSRKLEVESGKKALHIKKTRMKKLRKFLKRRFKRRKQKAELNVSEETKQTAEDEMGLLPDKSTSFPILTFDDDVESDDGGLSVDSEDGDDDSDIDFDEDYFSIVDQVYNQKDNVWTSKHEQITATNNNTGPFRNSGIPVNVSFENNDHHLHKPHPYLDAAIKNPQNSQYHFTFSNGISYSEDSSDLCIPSSLSVSEHSHDSFSAISAEYADDFSYSDCTQSDQISCKDSVHTKSTALSSRSASTFSNYSMGILDLKTRKRALERRAELIQQRLYQQRNARLLNSA